MVSLLIIGILLGMATLSIGNNANQRNIREEMRSLQQKMLLASREAIINHLEIGLRFSSTGYQFLLLDEKNQWRPLENDRLFRAHSLATSNRFFLQVEEQDVTLPSSSALPHLFFLSSGEQTPFQVDLHSTEKDFFRLRGDLNGLIQLTEIKPKARQASQENNP